MNVLDNDGRFLGKVMMVMMMNVLMDMVMLMFFDDGWAG